MWTSAYIEIDERPSAAVGNCVTKCVRNSLERRRSVYVVLQIFAIFRSRRVIARPRLPRNFSMSKPFLKLHFF